MERRISKSEGPTPLPSPHLVPPLLTPHGGGGRRPPEVPSAPRSAPEDPAPRRDLADRRLLPLDRDICARARALGHGASRGIESA